MAVCVPNDWACIVPNLLSNLGLNFFVGLIIGAIATYALTKKVYLAIVGGIAVGAVFFILHIL